MLSRDRISAIVARAASVLDVPAQVVATTPAGHDTHYVEVLLTVATDDAPHAGCSSGSIAMSLTRRFEPLSLRPSAIIRISTVSD